MNKWREIHLEEGILITYTLSQISMIENRLKKLRIKTRSVIIIYPYHNYVSLGEFEKIDSHLKPIIKYLSEIVNSYQTF